jgi:hypothetical protein
MKKGESLAEKHPAAARASTGGSTGESGRSVYDGKKLSRRSSRKLKEDEERTKRDEEERAIRNIHLATSAILRITYLELEDKFTEMITDAFGWMNMGADARRKAKKDIVAIQRTWRKKMAMRAAREFRMSRLSQLYHVEASVSEDECTRIQAHIRKILTSIRLKRGLDLVMKSDALVGSMKTMPKGRAAIELYKRCYNDFILSLRDKDAFSRVGTELFVHELLTFRENWNHQRAQKKASIFGTDAAEGTSPLAPPVEHPEPILSP